MWCILFKLKGVEFNESILKKMKRGGAKLVMNIAPLQLQLI